MASTVVIGTSNGIGTARRGMVAAVLVMVGLLLVPGGELQAQEPMAIEHPRVVSINPVALVILGLISAEYEQVLGGSTTWGSALSYFDFRNRTFFSVDGRLRYYLQDQPLEGLSVGALTGFTLVRRDSGEEQEGEDRGSAVAIGFTAERQWLLGGDRRLAITVGGGAKRLFFIRDVPGTSSVQPILRASLGWTF